METPTFTLSAANAGDVYLLCAVRDRAARGREGLPPDLGIVNPALRDNALARFGEVTAEMESTIGSFDQYNGVGEAPTFELSAADAGDVYLLCAIRDRAALGREGLPPDLGKLNGALAQNAALRFGQVSGLMEATIASFDAYEGE